MSEWEIVTNGKLYRIRHRTSVDKFDGKYVSFCGVAGCIPTDFPTIQKARNRIAELEQEEKDNTWVPIE